MILPLKEKIDLTDYQEYDIFLISGHAGLGIGDRHEKNTSTDNNIVSRRLLRYA